MLLYLNTRCPTFVLSCKGAERTTNKKKGTVSASSGGYIARRLNSPAAKHEIPRDAEGVLHPRAPKAPPGGSKDRDTTNQP